MKHVMTYLFCTVWLIAAALPASAVEKKGKDDKAKTEQSKKTTPQKELSKSAKDTTQKKSPSSSLAPSQRKFDDFIDNNRNGIDDRRENLKRKAPVKVEPKKNVDSAKTKP